jgi:lipopolysaccharide transport system ATP-binding protein
LEFVILKKEIINLDNISLSYPFFTIQDKSLRNTLSNFFRNKKRVTKRALQNISIKIYEGDRIGLIGHNGSGKSTLLRVISKIYLPNKGTVETNGKIVSLLDLNVGLEKEATGYENIYLISYSYGFSKKEVDDRIKKIIDFSGLEESINWPVRTYSSGMVSRLTSATLIFSNPEIFISDEFLGVGDKEFINKISNHFSNMINQSKVFILASHDHTLLKKICNRFIEIKDGKIISDKEKLD